jgi:hypothetical protein
LKKAFGRTDYKPCSLSSGLSSAAERPMKLAFRLSDWMVVYSSEAQLHQTIGIELPIIVPTGALLSPCVFVGEAADDERPELLDEPVVELAAQECLYRGASNWKFRSVPPSTIWR